MQRPPTPDLTKEQRKIAVRGGSAALVALVALPLAAIFLPRWFVFPTEVALQLIFVCQVNLFIGLWVVIAVRIVSRIRSRSAEDMSGSAYSKPSPRLAVAAAFLQNTLEQAFIAVVANLALVGVGGEGPMAFVTAAAVLFGLGRIAFRLGYPRGAGARAFGMVLTMTPTIMACLWAVFGMLAALA